MNQVIQGDCLEVMQEMPDDFFDCLISDPPAAIGFMGRAWDGDRGGAIQWINWLSEIMAEAMRVMKPGAVGAVWSIPRTCGYTQLALELAGFKIWDSVAVISGNGFPKAQDISAHIDKIKGCDRAVIPGAFTRGGMPSGVDRTGDRAHALVGVKTEHDRKQPITAPASPEAAHWDGWKTPALKPSHETWFLIQKPISETSIARNVLKHGVGGINVEAARIGEEHSYNLSSGSIGAGRERDCNVCDRGDGRTPDGRDYQKVAERQARYAERAKAAPKVTASGRYPANTILVCAPECTADNHADHCPMAILRETGTAARYFLQLPHDPDTFRYFTKASPNDRSCNGAVENRHPTVKNRELMAYFARLLCPPGGTILDPFGGSGSTALGAIMAGMDFVLIEQDPESVATAKARISTLAPASPSVPTPSLEQRVTWLETQVKALRNQRRTDERNPGQMSLF